MRNICLELSRFIFVCSSNVLELPFILKNNSLILTIHAMNPRPLTDVEYAELKIKLHHAHDKIIRVTRR